MLEGKKICASLEALHYASEQIVNMPLRCAQNPQGRARHVVEMLMKFQVRETDNLGQLGGLIRRAKPREAKTEPSHRNYMPEQECEICRDDNVDATVEHGGGSQNLCAFG